MNIRTQYRVKLQPGDWALSSAIETSFNKIFSKAQYSKYLIYLLVNNNILVLPLVCSLSFSKGTDSAAFLFDSTNWGVDTPFFSVRLILLSFVPLNTLRHIFGFSFVSCLKQAIACLLSACTRCRGCCLTQECQCTHCRAHFIHSACGRQCPSDFLGLWFMQ